jgi:hypothetical protein
VAPQTITTLPPILEDIDFVERSSFSPGEPAVVLNRYVYSTFTAPVSGTVQYQVTLAGSPFFKYTVNTTFNPGINSGYIGVTNVPLGMFGFSVVATAAGQTSTGSTPFVVTGAAAPAVNFAEVQSGWSHPTLSRSFAQEGSDYIRMDDQRYAPSKTVR